MYTKKNIDAYFYTTKGFYVFHIPVKVPYKQLYGMANAAGLKKKEEFGPILEQGKMFGFGWIGVEVEKPSENKADVIHVSGDFDVYEHKGPYKTLGKAYKKIMNEKSKAKEYFNLYLDNPEKVPTENLRTQILFR